MNSSRGEVEGAIRLALAQGSLFDFDAASARENFERSTCASAGARAHAGAGRLCARAQAPCARLRHRPAGTGKTWLAVARAVQLFERKEVDRIVLSRPAVEAGEWLGFLPGDMRERSILICGRSMMRSTI